jgi:hypothetical protein
MKRLTLALALAALLVASSPAVKAGDTEIPPAPTTATSPTVVDVLLLLITLK